MKPTFNLFYSITDERYYIYYNKDVAVFLFRVDNINPLNISRVTETGIMSAQLSQKILKEMEEFAVEEFKKLGGGF